MICNETQLRCFLVGVLILFEQIANYRFALLLFILIYFLKLFIDNLIWNGMWNAKKFNIKKYYVI